MLFPLFIVFMFAFVKIFALLILVQKMEIASYYAARRWQLESHRNVQFAGTDMSALRPDIEQVVDGYLGYNDQYLRGFYGIDAPPTVRVQETEVWNIVTLTVRITALNMGQIGTWFNIPVLYRTLTVTKYVPNRDRPILFQLPGGQSG